MSAIDRFREQLSDARPEPVGQGTPVERIDPSAPLRRGDAIEIVSELRRMRQAVEELVDVDSGAFVSVPKRVIINAANPFDVFKVLTAPNEFHAVKIDNPSAVDVEVKRGGTIPLAGTSDERIPPRTGRLLTFPYTEIAIGIDPAVMPGGNTVLYVTYYSRPFAPSTYAFAP